MSEAYICDYVRTPIGRYAGALSGVRADDLAAIAKGRHPGLGQVIVRVAPTPQDVETCAIGAAAWVDFPQINAIDLLRARLRL